VPTPAEVGAKLKFTTQPLPVLTDAHSKLEGPLQPGGKVVSDRAKPVTGSPSLDANVTLTVRLAPTAADTVPPTELVATTEFAVPAGTAPPKLTAPGFELFVEGASATTVAAEDPLLSLVELAPHPDSIAIRNDAGRTERYLCSMSLDSRCFRKPDGGNRASTVIKLGAERAVRNQLRHAFRVVQLGTALSLVV
jgi:hypothetical protein